MKKIDETEEICVVDYLIPRTDERIFDYTKVRRFGEDNFTMKIGGTTYEVSTHFNPKGRLFSVKWKSSKRAPKCEHPKWHKK